MYHWSPIPVVYISLCVNPAQCRFSALPLCTGILVLIRSIECGKCRRLGLRTGNIIICLESYKYKIYLYSSRRKGLDFCECHWHVGSKSFQQRATNERRLFRVRMWRVLWMSPLNATRTAPTTSFANIIWHNNVFCCLPSSKQQASQLQQAYQQTGSFQ